MVMAEEQAGAGTGTKMTIEQRQQERLEKLTKALDLTKDQQSKISALMTARSEKMTGGKNTREEMKAINENYVSQVKALLTPEQVTKYETLLKNQKHHESQ
jgi:Spy/CpxP family protein refolding chaperone